MLLLYKAAGRGPVPARKIIYILAFSLCSCYNLTQVAKRPNIRLTVNITGSVVDVCKKRQRKNDPGCIPRISRRIKEDRI